MHNGWCLVYIGNTSNLDTNHYGCHCKWKATPYLTVTFVTPLIVCEPSVICIHHFCIKKFVNNSYGCFFNTRDSPDLYKGYADGS